MSLTTYLKDDKSPISDRAESITGTIIEEAKSSDLESALWKAWRELFKYAATTSASSQGALVDILKAIQSREDPKDEDGKPYQIWGEAFKWQNLPLLGAQAREEWDIVPDTSSPQEDQQGWINRNAFLAQLTAVSKPQDALDFALYGIWTIRVALEEVDIQSSLAAETDIKAAAVWFLYAGKTLKGRSVDGQDFDGRMAREGNALGDKDWKGFNQERWDYWVKILEVVQGKTKDEESKELLGAALEAIE